MTIKTHGRMFTDDTVGITQLALQDGTANQAIVTDGQGVLRFATVGAGGSVGSSVYVEDIRTGDGTTATFTLSVAAPYEESILVFIDGVAQPTSSFTLPTTESITFSPAPGNGAAIRICHLGIASSVGNNSITGAHIAMGGDTVGDVLYFNGTDYQRLVIGTALQIFRTNAATTAPEWVDATTASLPATGADGNVLTSTGSNWVSEAPLGGVGGEIVSVQTFSFTTVNAQQTWTRPSGVKRIVVHLVGAGGHATGTIGGNQHVGGGGSGGYCMGIYDVTNLATATVEIGCGEDAQNHGGTPAGIAANRDSVFSGTGITTMNAGGGGATYYLTSVAGGAGGTASGGALNMVGEPGEVGGDGSETDHYDHARTGGHAGGPFGGTFGRGADGQMIAAVQDGGDGYCIVEEYSDVSASLVGEKLTSFQFLTAAGAGTWTKPANITKIVVHAVGGGGGVHSVGGGNNAVGSGGGGGYSSKIYNVSDVTTLAYVVGAGGAGASTTPALNNGVASTFHTGGDQISGGGGLGLNDSTSGGGGGPATGGHINVVGSSGNLAEQNGQTKGGDAAGPFGGDIGRGGLGQTGSLQANTAGSAGCILVEEYTDPTLISGGLSGVADEEYLCPVANSVTPATGVWTRPAGVTQIEVQLIGAGGGGGRNTLTGGTGYGGKGGEGGLVKRVIDVRSLATIDYFVGTRGLGVASGSANGATGGTVSFGHNGTALSTALTVTVTGGAITAITNPGAAGSGITLAPLIFIEPDVKIVGSAVGGSGATAVATISGGAVTGITVTNGGTGYVQGSVIASFGLNAIGGTGGTTTGGGTNGLAGANGLHFGNKGNFEPWTMGGGSSDLTIPYREVGSGGIGALDAAAGHGQHGAIYIRSYR